jgi:hypothetical protein
MVQSREEFNAKRRKDYAKPETKAKKKAYYDSNKSEILEKRKKHGAKPETKARIKLRLQTPENIIKNKILRENLKLEVFSVYSKRHSDSNIPCCRCCGENSHTDFLTMDHIDGRKASGHKRNFNGTQLNAELKKKNFPDGFQVLCWNCNMVKGFYGKCPHEK